MSNVTSVTATLDWSGSGGTVKVNGLDIGNTDQTTYRLVNLKSATDYEVSIINEFGESNIIEFTTLEQRSVTEFDDFTDISKWRLQGNQTTTSVSVDTENTLSNQSLKLTVTNNSDIAFVRNNTLDLDLTEYSAFDVVVYVDDPSKLENFIFFIGNDIALTNRATITYRPSGLKVGWNHLTFSFDMLSKFGDFDISENMKSMQLRITATDEEGTFVSFERIDLIKGHAGNVIFIADDGWESQYTEFYRILQENGLKGNIAVIKNRVGNTGYMTEDQLKEVDLHGTSLINHTESHLALDTLDKESQRTELLNTKDYLTSIGASGGNMVAYPMGRFNQDTLDIMAEEGFIWGRSLKEGFELGEQTGNYTAFCKNLTGAVTAQAAKDIVVQAIETGSTVLFLNHLFTDNDADLSTTTYWKIDRFEELATFVRGQIDAGLVRNLNVPEFLERSE